jgi:integrase
MQAKGLHLMPTTVTKRPGRKAYYAWLEGRYVSTGETDQREAVRIAGLMERIGVDAYRQGQRTLRDTLPELIEDHLASLRERDGRDREHIRKKRTQLIAPVDGGTFRTLADVKPRAFRRWLDGLTCGPKTKTEYLTAWNVFLDWLVYEERLDENPIKDRVRRPRVTKDDRQERRALTEDELRRLLEVSGPRSLLYEVAAVTGARRKELELLKWADVHEDGETPHLVLRAETTKNGKGRIQCLTPETAAALAERRERAKSERVFGTMPSHHTVRRDFDAAGIEHQTDGGTASFHSLRHTAATRATRATQDARIAQRLAGHAHITTTQRYLHADLEEQAAVMRMLPSLRATGRATGVVETGPKVSQREPSRRSGNGPQVPENGAFRPDVSQADVRSLEVEPGGIEPPCRDSPCDASTCVAGF